MKYIKKFFSGIWKFTSCIIEDNIGLYAAQASFFMIISSVPFIMLLLALVKFFVPIDPSHTMSAIGKYIPHTLLPWINTVINEIFNKSSNISIISVTAVTTLWLSSRGFMALYAGVNNVFGIKDIPNYFYCRLISLFYTICFLAAMFLAIIMFVFGNKIQAFLYGKYTILYDIVSFLMSMRIIIFLTLVSLFFAAFYTFFPKKKVKFKSQIPGAVLASLGWMGFSYAYSLYIEYFSNYSYVYGSLTAIIFLMLWLYFCMDIFLYGAEFNRMLADKSFD